MANKLIIRLQKNIKSSWRGYLLLYAVPCSACFTMGYCASVLTGLLRDKTYYWGTWSMVGAIVALLIITIWWITRFTWSISQTKDETN